MPLNIIALTLIAFLLSGCATDRKKITRLLANKHGWSEHTINTSHFSLRAYLPPETHEQQTINIYIEGDGHAWSNPKTPSKNPTPRNPIALKLALADHNNKSAYIARPCQYVIQPSLCQRKYWTSARYSREVIRSVNDAINTVLKQTQSHTVNLIGYSGGGVVALLIALERTDVDKVITISSNLDHKEWALFHGVSLLKKSLNPSDYVDQLATIEQHHFVGKEDKNTPPKLLNKFIAQFPHTHTPQTYIIPKFTHSCCWERDWSKLINLLE